MLFNLILKKELAIKLSATMGYFQLLTALSGGILAFFVIKIFTRNLFENK